MQKQLKIGIVFDDSLDRNDGVQQYVKYIGRWLQTHGQTVEYLVGQSDPSLNPDLTIHSLSKNIKVHGNQNILSIPLPAKRRAIRQLLAAQNYDILHVQVPFNPLLAGRVIAQAPDETAIIGTFHIVGASWLENIGSKLLGKLQYKTLHRFDKMLSVSSAANEYAKKYWGLDSQILPNVVDIAKFSAGNKRQEISGNRVSVIYINRLVKRKGAQYLIGAFSELKRTNRLKNRQLIICGGGPLKDKLTDMVKQLGLEQNIKFAGFIAEEDKPDYLASADLAVFPSTGGESFGIVLIEAMAAGTLTLGGNNAGYSTVLKNFPEVLFDPKNQAKLADLIDTMLSDKAKADRLQTAQYQEVQKYSVDNIGTELLEIYRQLLKRF